MGYYFYFDKVLLPVAPEKITTKINNNNKTYTLINEGEINILKTVGLTDIEFDVLLPNVQYAFATYKDGFKDAKYFLDVFEELKVNKSTFQFIVTRTLPNGKLLFDTNMKVSLESYTSKEDVKQGFDVKATIKLKQYKDYGTKICNITFTSSKPIISTTSSRSAGTNAPSTGGTYTVKQGDTLWGIAKYFYGNGAMYTAIYEVNKSVIGSNPNLIYPNQVLIIPNAASSVDVSSTSASVKIKPSKNVYGVYLSSGKLLKSFPTYNEALNFYHSNNGDKVGLVLKNTDTGEVLPIRAK